MRELFLPDKNFRNQVLKTAGPIAFQNISVSLLSLMDTAIIKSLGEGPMGAVSLANQLTFLTNNMTFGLSSGASRAIMASAMAKRFGRRFLSQCF